MTNPDYDRRTDGDDIRVEDARAEDLRTDEARTDDVRTDEARTDDLGRDDSHRDDSRGEGVLMDDSRDARAEDSYVDDRSQAGGDRLDAEDNGGRPQLLDDSGQLLERWQHVQAAFVDSPRDAVGEASDIVGDVLEKLSRSFDAERRRLDDEWEAGGEPSTEDLRLALRRYRAFFERLLAA